jgi:predicted AlkP superfamily pyrophosphatase or phosphodiesterase
VILSGANPSLTGIGGNEWIDRKTNQPVYCVEDKAYQWVGAPTKGKQIGSSPANLHSSTVGDALKLATNDQARVVSLSLKDRAAILLGGKMADRVLWYDKHTGRWITSTYYAPDRRLPAWVEEENRSGFVQRFGGREWTPLLSLTEYARSRPLSVPTDADGKPLGATFPHVLTNTSDPKFYDTVTRTPFGNDLTLHLARAAVRAERLGQDAVPDLLAINLSSNDYVGHAYGPDSPEVQDMCLRTDRQLAEFFDFLASSVPGGLDRVLLVVTSDHGVAPVPEEARKRKLDAGRIPFAAIIEAANAGLSRAYGAGDWTAGFTEPALSLRTDRLAAKNVPAREAEEIAARAIEGIPGVLAAYARSQILEGRLPDTPIARAVSRGYSREVGGDVVVVPRPYWFLDEGDHLTTHGSPYPYDTHVPLLLRGPGVRPGAHSQAVQLTDLAPTLSTILRIEMPGGCEGRSLQEALSP